MSLLTCRVAAQSDEISCCGRLVGKKYNWHTYLHSYVYEFLTVKFDIQSSAIVFIALNNCNSELKGCLELYSNLTCLYELRFLF